MKKNNNHTAIPAEPRLKPWAMWMVNIGLLAIAAATALPLLQIGAGVFEWIYAAGAALTLISRIATIGAYRGMTLRVRRLGRMELWSAIIFAVGCFFVFNRRSNEMDWLAFTLAGAMLQAYASIMVPRAIRAEKRGDHA